MPTTPRPRDFLEAEIIRYHNLRRTHQHPDPAIEASRQSTIDRHIDILLDELAAT